MTNSGTTPRKARQLKASGHLHPVVLPPSRCSSGDFRTMEPVRPGATRHVGTGRTRTFPRNLDLQLKGPRHSEALSPTRQALPRRVTGPTGCPEATEPSPLADKLISRKSRYPPVGSCTLTTKLPRLGRPCSGSNVSVATRRPAGSGLATGSWLGQWTCPRNAGGFGCRRFMLLSEACQGTVRFSDVLAMLRVGRKTLVRGWPSMEFVLLRPVERTSQSFAKR